MSLLFVQKNTFISKGFTVFASLLFILARQSVTGNDEWCSEETLLWGSEKLKITWPKTIPSNKLITSECMFNLKLLLTRCCDDRTNSWDPTISTIEDLSLCEFYQPSYERYGNCPPGYIESETSDLCYQQVIAQPWEKVCLTTGASSLSFLDLKSHEQYNILQELLALKSNGDPKVNIGLPAKNQWPNKQINSDIDYKIADVELQWLLPGRYGSILKFSNNSAAVICSHMNLCVDMCLSINITESTYAKPFTPTIDECANINSVLCVSRKNSVVRKEGCFGSGYYRVGYYTSNYLCYSIKELDQPLHINDDSSDVIQLYCGQNKIFDLDSIESHIIYRQLANTVELGTHERCLFGMSLQNSIIKYGDWTGWDQTYRDTIKFTNWDRSQDYSEVQSGDSYLTVNSEGKWMWEKSATCIVCAMDDPPMSSELILQSNNSNSELTLNVIWPENLWKESDGQLGFLCFALIANNYIDNVRVIPTSQCNFYSLHNHGAGKYWCSGHLIKSIALIESDVVYAFGMVFVFDVEYDCEGQCDDLINCAGKFENFLESLIDEDLMNIEELQYIEQYDLNIDMKVGLIFHVTISVDEGIAHDNEYNGIGLSEDQLYTYYTVKNLRQLIHSDKEIASFDILSVTSKEFCLPDLIISPSVLNWKAAKVGQTVKIFENCLTFTRTCSNGSKGAVWDDYTFDIVCNNQSQVSVELIDLHNSFRTSNQTQEVIFNLSSAIHNVTLNEADVFVVSEIVEKISNFFLSDQISLSDCDLKNVFDIFNSLMLISQDVARSSVQLNSTNNLLASFDEILIHQAKHTTLTDNESFPDGVESIKFSLIASYIFDPMVSGFSGIALLENNVTNHKDFLSHLVRFLHPNQSSEALLKEENLILASFVPHTLVTNLKKPKIIFTLFFNDILFQSRNHEANSDGTIISLSIINSESKLSNSIPFFFKPNNSLFHRSNYMSAQFCGYWSFLSDSGWESAGCMLNELALQISDTILCECSHLTHFGNLVNTEIMYSEIDEKVLNLITLAGCALSLIGIIGIFLTAIVFRSWRSKYSSKFLLQLSAAIALQMILLVFINSDDDLLVSISGNLYGCIATGALVHYSILVMFFWMLIVAYLQFIRYVIVFNQIATANFLLKSSIFGWGMPMLPVFIVVAVDPRSYIPSKNVKFCYPNGYGLLFGLLVPIILIVIANIFVFLAVVVSLIKGSSKSAACKVNDKNEATWSQLRLSVFLFFILGLSWIFGFLSDRSVIFSYLFCLTATLQGFVLFLYFVILDPVARNLWKQLFMKMCGYKTY